MSLVRIGMVCPYSLDVPGGVQNHVRDLTASLRTLGHDVSVLAPGSDDRGRTGVVSAGRAVPLRYNGAVARVTFGPTAMARTARWLRDGDFDLLHVHDPATPSASLMALSLSSVPSVATFHTSISRSRALAVAEPLIRPALEKLSARISVSEHARTVVRRYLGGDSAVIPNGLFVGSFCRRRRPRDAGDAPTLLFLGRFGERRKGLPVLLDAFVDVLHQRPDARLVVAGAGDTDVVRPRLDPVVAARVDLLGQVDDETRAALLADADVYVAPHTGGESFGIVLVEALAAGVPVVASDIPAFSSILDSGRWGVQFHNRDARGLAKTVLRLLEDPDRDRRADCAREHVSRYDWAEVTPQVLAVYDDVLRGRRTS